MNESEKKREPKIQSIQNDIIRVPSLLFLCIVVLVTTKKKRLIDQGAARITNNKEQKVMKKML